MRKYKVVIYQEGLLGSLVLGQSKVDPVKFSAFLNDNAADGWRVITMEKDIRRMLLFFKREAFMVVMERDETEADSTRQEALPGFGQKL